jgi:hypothetical protein
VHIRGDARLDADADADADAAALAPTRQLDFWSADE